MQKYGYKRNDMSQRILNCRPLLRGFTVPHMVSEKILQDRRVGWLSIFNCLSKVLISSGMNARTFQDRILGHQLGALQL